MLELKSKRDVYVVMLLGFFILLAGFLFNQSPLIALYQLFPITAILNALMVTHSIQTEPGLLSRSLGLTFKRLIKYLILALPLMIVLFVFFPRLSGPIWKMPGGSSGGSGISETMSPGEISSLRLFNKVAFRVKFNGKEPTGNQLYWRTLVLDNFDGLTWSRDSNFSRLEKTDNSNVEPAQKEYEQALNQPSKNQDEFEYEISLEITKLQWLTMLDRPVKIPSRSVLYDDYSVQVEHRLTDRVRYNAKSIPSLKLQPTLSNRARIHNTRIPESNNQRSIKWAKQQRNNFSDDKKFVHSVLSRINQQAYFYTLSPPIMAEDTIDSFWFDEQRGFCEHYAAALVFLSRAAGIPARVVVGYQGAEKNPLSDYWIVRYANAHAWTEIWFENEGWVRVDPTAAIAPQRIEEQLQLDYSQRDSLFGDFGFDAVDLDNVGWAKQIQYWMDTANTGWNDWVLDYNRQAQRKLFAGLGLEQLSIQEISVLMISILSLFMLVMSFRWVKAKQKKEPISRAFYLLLSKLNDRGLVFDTNVGARDILESLEGCKKPEHINKVIKLSSAKAVVRVLKRYIHLRYVLQSINLEQQEAFLKQVKKLKIQSA